ncbi:DUF418 domain-containing protein [Kitasatospora sp. NPDC008115]|uniref:DUF418 domain-containing protein n=1 Tax=Kitasatospora sp. NPDC008115 TaxID=3364022 RepID=UPI0036E3BA81
MAQVSDRIPARPSATAHPDRLPLPDVLRGVAILGTLMTNVWIFAAPAGEWGALTGATSGATLNHLLDAPSPALAAETLFRLAADGKFLAMLTVLFGVGLAIQYDSARRRGLPWPRSYRPRAWFLLAEGTVHFVLVFAWDVLMAYALCSLLVSRLLVASDRVQRTVLRAAVAFHLVLMTALSLLLALGDEVSATGEGPDAAAVDLYAHGSYLDQIAFRLANTLALRIEPVLSFALLMALFLLGVRLFRAGAFAPGEEGRRLRSRLLAWGLGTGLPLSLASSLAGADGFLIQRYVAAPALALGYVGLVGVILDRVARPPLTRSLTAVGRTALSCYVGQNLLCMLACYGIGLGLAERLRDSGPWWVMGLWAAVSLILVLGARLWLHRFPTGPLESVQRLLLRRPVPAAPRP